LKLLHVQSSQWFIFYLAELLLEKSWSKFIRESQTKLGSEANVFDNAATPLQRNKSFDKSKATAVKRAGKDLGEERQPAAMKPKPLRRQTYHGIYQQKMAVEGNNLRRG